MALIEIESKRIEKVVGAFIERHRPPPHIRKDVDLGFRITGQSVEIFEIRPRYQRPAEKIEIKIAKATLVRSRNNWKVLWQRRDLKWHRYDPVPEVETLEAFLELVEKDAHAAFFG